MASPPRAANAGSITFSTGAIVPPLCDTRPRSAPHTNNTMTLLHDDSQGKGYEPADSSSVSSAPPTPSPRRSCAPARGPAAPPLHQGRGCSPLPPPAAQAATASAAVAGVGGARRAGVGCVAQGRWRGQGRGRVGVRLRTLPSWLRAWPGSLRAWQRSLPRWVAGVGWVVGFVGGRGKGWRGGRAVGRWAGAARGRRGRISWDRQSDGNVRSWNDTNSITAMIPSQEGELSVCGDLT